MTGKEALRAHIKDSTDNASSIAEREASGRPIILGERTISGTPATIAELMHGDIDTTAKADGSEAPGTTSSETKSDAYVLEQPSDVNEKEKESHEHHEDH